MKKILLLVPVMFLLAVTANTQVAANNEKQAALQLVHANQEALGLSATDIDNVFVSSAYRSAGTDLTLVYLQQSYQHIPVYNKMMVLAFKEGQVVSNTGALLNDMDKMGLSASPSINENQAVKKAFAELKLGTPFITTTKRSADGLKIEFGQLAGTYENVTAELLWFPLEESGHTAVKLVWSVVIGPAGTDDMWQVMIDAATGKVVDKLNLVVFESFNHVYTTEHPNPLANKQKIIAPFKNASETNNSNAGKYRYRPSLVSTVNYNVIPYPFESPSFAPATIKTNPWILAPGNATTLGWHSNGTTDFTISRGNNVWATEDTLGVNQNTGLPATSSTSPDPLNFTTPPNYSVEPSRDPAMQQFCITNLFYWNNIIHDILYQYGFDEPAGNFQENNLGRGGVGNDHVMALAQSGAAGHIGNNANFLTPSDGGRGRMRMYLFNAVSTTTLTVNTPGAIAGNYGAIEGSFSTANLLSSVGPVSGQVVYYNDDAAGNTHYACNAPANSITGKIALIDRGFGGAICTATVPFTTKVKNAQNAGAIAVIMVNNVSGGPIVMGGTDNTITIPAVMISQSDGAIFAGQLANNLTVTMSGTPPQPRDGDLDAGIMCHEFGHGVSNRLTGGPAAANCLNNAEEGGEGWSDYLGLMMTTNWLTATINDGPNLRPVGTYAVGQPTNAVGIRNYPYTTNITVNPLTYQHMGLGAVTPWLFSNGSEVHNIGEIWCIALWEMTWGIIQQQGTINQNLYDFSLATQGGNSIALKLVLEGMKLQPCSPGFLDARNAILAADKNIYGGSHQCAIWTAFAKRGMGYSALQGSSNSTTDQTAAFDLPPAPTITTQPVDVTVNVGANATFTVANTAAINGANIIYKWQVSTNGGSTWSDIFPPVTTSSLTLTAVTAGMNGNKYRCILQQGCATTTSTAATLTVNVPSGFTFNSPAPATANCPAPASMSITLGTTSVGGFSNTITLSAIAGVPAGTNVTFAPNPVTPGNSSVVTLNNTNTLSAGSYTITIQGVATGASNQTRDLTFTINAGTGPAITVQPADQTLCAGGNTSFSITSATATSFQWQVSIDNGATYNNVTNNTLYAGATTAILSLTGVTGTMNGYRYRCIASTTCGTTTSNAAILTVNTAPNITTQPQSTSACAGGSATFTVAATGTGLTYQWQLSLNGCSGPWTNIVGANTASLTLSGITAGQNNTGYQCIVSGTCPSPATSGCALLTVATSVTVTTQPNSQTICEGSPVSFTVAGSGTGIIYQWQLSTNGGSTWNNISGANAATYTIPAVTFAMNGNQYRCQLSNATCTTPGVSNAATLTVNTLPTISTQPQNSTICAGSNTTFSVTASGTGLTYQWQINPAGCSGATWNNIVNGPPYSGVNTATLTIAGATAGMNGAAYRCIVSGACTPSVTSTCVVLTVNTAAAITAQPVSVNVCATGSISFSVTATGSSPAYQWQESTNGGSTWNNITNGGIYSGGTSATLTLNGITAAMNNNRYRCVVTVVACGSVNSNSAALNVTPQPVITASPYTSLLPGQNTTLTVNVAPGPGLTFAWYLNGTLLPGVTGNSVIAGINQLGSYRVIVSSASGSCQSELLTIKDSLSTKLFVFPSPNNGQFTVAYYNNGGAGTQRTVIIADSKGSMVYRKQFAISGPYTLLNIDLQQAGTGIYIVELFDNSGKKLAEGKVHIR